MSANLHRSSRQKKLTKLIIAVCLASIAIGGILIVVAVSLESGDRAKRESSSGNPSLSSFAEKVRPDPTAINTPPTLNLGVAGGEPELARCDGTFTHMISYGDAVAPVWAAHNDCGGDVVLGWDMGQSIQIDNGKEVITYQVIDIRDTGKVGATTDDLAGLRGDIILQSCYYDMDRMKFLGLTPVP